MKMKLFHRSAALLLCISLLITLFPSGMEKVYADNYYCKHGKIVDESMTQSLMYSSKGVSITWSYPSSCLYNAPSYIWWCHGFNIYRKELDSSEAPYTKINYVSSEHPYLSDTYTYTDVTVEKNKAYSYYVSAIYNYDDEIHPKYYEDNNLKKLAITTHEFQAPSFNENSKGIELKWNTVNNANYDVFFRASNDSKFTKINRSKIYKTSYIHKITPQKGQTYSYYVVAYASDKYEKSSYTSTIVSETATYTVKSGNEPAPGDDNGGNKPDTGGDNGGNKPGTGGDNGGNKPDTGGDNGGNKPGTGGDNGGNKPGTGGDNGGNKPGTGGDNGGNKPGTGGNNGGNKPGTGGDNGGNKPGTGGDNGGNKPGTGGDNGGNKPITNDDLLGKDNSLPKPTAPKLVSLKNTSKGITLTWKPSKNATGYQIYRKVNKGMYLPIKTVYSKKKFTFTDPYVMNNAKYSYRLYAFNDDHSVKGKAKTIYRIGKPKLKSVKKASATSASVRWTTAQKVSGYQIRFEAKGKTIAQKVKGQKTASRLIKKLSKGKTYKVSIRSYKKVGKSTYYSAWSASKKVKIK